jgi:hypothetical protein
MENYFELKDGPLNIQKSNIKAYKSMKYGTEGTKIQMTLNIKKNCYY